VEHRLLILQAAQQPPGIWQAFRGLLALPMTNDNDNDM
jgi:hypothetical protein